MARKDYEKSKDAASNPVLAFSQTAKTVARTIAKRPYVRYKFDVPSGARPKVLFMPTKTSAIEDIVLLAGNGMEVSTLTRPQFHYSESLESQYRYVGGENSTMEFSHLVAPGATAVEVTLIKWNRRNFDRLPPSLAMQLSVLNCLNKKLMEEIIIGKQSGKGWI